MATRLEEVINAKSLVALLWHCQLYGKQSVTDVNQKSSKTWYNTHAVLLIQDMQELRTVL